jgi:hypothetical protein
LFQFRVGRCHRVGGLLPRLLHAAYADVHTQQILQGCRHVTPRHLPQPHQVADRRRQPFPVLVQVFGPECGARPLLATGTHQFRILVFGHHRHDHFRQIHNLTADDIPHRLPLLRLLGQYGSAMLALLRPDLLDPIRVLHRLSIVPHVSGLATRLAPAFLPRRVAAALSAR